MAYPRATRRFLLGFHREMTMRIHELNRPAAIVSHQKRISVHQTRYTSSKAVFSTKPRCSEATTAASKTQETQTTEDDISTRLRLLMRSVPHSVTVITTSDRVSPSPSKQSPPFEGCYGVTISSFSTVTLGPPSIITFNLRWPSRTLDAIRKQGIFRVHTLLGDAGGRDIAHAFVELAHADAFQKLASEGVAVSTAPNNNTTSPRAEAAVGDAIPTIHGPGVMASLLCKAIPEKCVEIGDHIVIIAEVLTINTAERGHDSNQQSPPGQQSLADRDLRDDGEVDYGLLYVQQRYGSPNVSWGVDENEDEDSSER